MIDDLANVWVDTNNNGKLELGEDWGFWKNKKNSSFRYLNENILNYVPEVKVTFFVPVGVRVGMIQSPIALSISDPINKDEDTKRFFREIHENPKFEIAYHGTTHGRPGITNKDFKQEWELFKDIDEAIETIEKGKNIYREAIGINPIGGKYCGYTSNELSDKSINETGFLWWCRYWNRGIDEFCIPNITGIDQNPLTNFDVKTFGPNKVIDIPSTINGALLNDLFNESNKSVKGFIKGLLKKTLIRKRMRQLDFLLENNLIISIQEHIAPSRDDGRRQGPNIFDDRDGLLYMFNYLKDKNVWYCTGSELAEYVRIRDNCEIKLVDEKRFIIKNSGYKSTQLVSLLLNEQSISGIYLPNGIYIKKEKQYVNVPILEGVYTLERNKA
ncbi:hypothetical protein BK716_06610 [Bacillus thuringiensis serovar higo]|uniref:Uncharacterized protein n=2 Tax=Bacillus thuringiensis TaxID=1428 RepID=A0A9X6LVU3_BACUH|nr:hypothetical protein BK716_06610 [Bacillus thuringiensis serovar higo]